jgi:hypothetical protein
MGFASDKAALCLVATNGEVEEAMEQLVMAS